MFLIISIKCHINLREHVTNMLASRVHATVSSRLTLVRAVCISSTMHGSPQGDQEMYTPKNIAARKKLFDHPDVVLLVKLFWNVVTSPTLSYSQTH